jgi:biotin transport system substrate-specific component
MDEMNQRNTLEAVIETKVRPLTAGEVWPLRLAIVITASAFVALCARISVPLPYSPVPVTMSNFAVLLVGLLLGSRLGFAALVLYLLEGAAGLPVFSHGSLGLLGPTGGYLMAYPFVALLAGWISERGTRSFTRAFCASAAAEVLLFAVGISWLMIAFHTPLYLAVQWGIYPFLAAEVAKVLAAAGISNRMLARKS